MFSVTILHFWKILLSMMDTCGLEWVRWCWLICRFVNHEEKGKLKGNGDVETPRFSVRTVVLLRHGSEKQTAVERATLKIYPHLDVAHTL